MESALYSEKRKQDNKRKHPPILLTFTPYEILYTFFNLIQKCITSWATETGDMCLKWGRGLMSDRGGWGVSGVRGTADMHRPVMR